MFTTCLKKTGGRASRKQLLEENNVLKELIEVAQEQKNNADAHGQQKQKMTTTPMAIMIILCSFIVSPSK